MIFFDIDGTLLDHNNSEYYGIVDIIKMYSEFSSIDRDSIYSFWRKISDKHFEKYLRREISFTQQRIERIKELFCTVKLVLSDKEAEEIFNIYIQKYEKNWKAYEDVIPCLLELSEFRLGIISNGDKEQQILKLYKLGILDYFSTIVISSEVGIAKPDKKIFKVACEKAGVNATNCFYVGDSLKTDILPCKEIGMNAIWLNRGKEKTELLEIKMIYSLKDLKKDLSRISKFC